MKILISGGAGFIGLNFVKGQIEHHPNDELFILDKLTYAADTKGLQPLVDDGLATLLMGDICDRPFVEKAFKEYGFDLVVNFAAESHVDNSIENPELFLKTNIIGTSILLDTCRKFGVERMHQVSTDEVYGDLPLNRPDIKFTEESPLRPSSPYSASKTAADLLCLAYHRTYGLPITISRCSNNYGPHQNLEKLIPKTIHNAAYGKKIPVYGKGENVRDWIYAEDHCNAIDVIMREGRDGHVYNVGGNCERRNIEIVKLILRELDKPEGLIEFVKDRPGHDLRYAIDSTMIKESLGWTPQMNFEDGIRKTIDWYLTSFKG